MPTGNATILENIHHEIGWIVWIAQNLKFPTESSEGKDKKCSILVGGDAAWNGSGYRDEFVKLSVCEFQSILIDLRLGLN